MAEIKPAAESKNNTDEVRNREVDVDERFRLQLQHINYSIHRAINKGKYETSVILPGEINEEDIYQKVIALLIAKGYKVNASSYNHGLIFIKWS
jgi:hypothetical protein